jgi:hypothetical protein
VRASEFLVEYNRQVTAKQVGDRVLDALHKDRSADLPNILHDVALDSFRAKKGEEPQPSPEQKQKWIEAVLAAIEAKDPTSNKAYTPWLAKMYVKGGLPIEDMNRNDMLRLYDIAKKRRMIKPEHADINRFKWYQDFEDTMENDYDNLEGVEQGKEQEQGAAKKVYEDDNVMVIVPEDEAAACKYGRNTRWCTAATRGYNYFDQYNRQGPLYILIPKKPEHEGEKYQLHFPTSQYMDEDDDSVSLLSVFHRFPELTEFFMKNEPDLKNNIVLMDNDQLQSIIDQVSQLAIERMDEEVSEWETADDGYRGYLLDTYPDPDEEGSIDWEEVEKNDEGYLSYNDDARKWIKKMTHALTPTPNDLKTTAQEMAANGELHDLTPEKIPDIMAEMVKDEFRSDLHLHDGDIPYFLKEKVLIKNNDGNWSAQVVYSQPVQARRR